MMADDVNFVNMTPTANDMQFEKWLNYLINIISRLISAGSIPYRLEIILIR
jgi:hypothetical protein